MQILDKIKQVFLLVRLINIDQIRSFRLKSKEYISIVNSFYSIEELRELNSNGYSWDDWREKLRTKFRNNLSISFLRDQLINFTMVFSDSNIEATEVRIDLSKKVYLDQIRNLLEEDFIGLPLIANSMYLTSANRAHHVMHMSKYKETTHNDIWDATSIIEWGGGYGNFSRVIYKMNPNVQYTIIDLPELLAVQYVYLSSLGIKVNLIKSKVDKLLPGCINLVSSIYLTNNIDFNIKADTFISTWAISECPEYLQDFVYKNDFFGARKILIASKIDGNNKLSNLEISNIKKIAVPFFVEEHQYWFK